MKMKRWAQCFVKIGVATKKKKRNFLKAKKTFSFCVIRVYLLCGSASPRADRFLFVFFYFFYFLFEHFFVSVLSFFICFIHYIYRERERESISTV